MHIKTDTDYSPESGVDTLMAPALSTTVIVFSPNGGTFREGDVLTVQWDTQGPVGTHAVLLSQDNRQTYMQVTCINVATAAGGRETSLSCAGTLVRRLNNVAFRTRPKALYAPHQPHRPLGDAGLAVCSGNPGTHGQAMRRPVLKLG
jgi:hypothetical protein